MNIQKEYLKKLRKLVFRIRELAKSGTKKAKILERLDDLRILDRNNNKLTQAEKRLRTEERSRLAYTILLLDKCIKHYRLFCEGGKNKDHFKAFIHEYKHLVRILADKDRTKFKLTGEAGRGYYLKGVKDERQDKDTSTGNTSSKPGTENDKTPGKNKNIDGTTGEVQVPAGQGKTNNDKAEGKTGRPDREITEHKRPDEQNSGRD